MAEVGGSAIRLIDRDGDPLDDGNGKLNINATLEAASVNIGDVDILTVPAPLNLTGGGTESSALRVTLANDSTGVLSIDDNGGSLTIDGIITVSNNVETHTSYSSIASGENSAVGTSAEVLTSSTACKHVDLMAAIANTGIIYVGGSGVAANTGIALYPGDVYSVDIDNLNDIYVVATVDGENIQYTYYN
jgi:hypothetical protein